MSPLICLFGSVTLFAYGGQCELAWDKVYGLLSARIDNIILEQEIIKHEQDVMKKHMKDLITSITATNQQFSEVASFNQKPTSVQERLENIDSHLKEVASVEMRTGAGEGSNTVMTKCFAEKWNVQSDMNVLMNASDVFRGQMSEFKENLKSTLNKTAKLVSSTEDKMNTHLNETRVHISYLEKEMDKSIRRIETTDNQLLASVTLTSELIQKVEVHARYLHAKYVRDQ
ncbi:hypothetical protein DPMN_031045 [Dreissena polymorpha]|uniref:Uncharacterized protein n=1 Tax=Dreissena polymorpha TaxID=45954 RepID=A0A9D4M068_DREPO|nr:hypothetical protein DPMN_031045 [Dreissena polymorpha]